MHRANHPCASLYTHSPDCRHLVRWVRSRPIVEELHELILTERSPHLPKSELGEALNYTLGHWDQFRFYLHDGALEIDNNLVENAIRPTKLEAKNWLFIGGSDTGQRSAILYTFIESTSRNCIHT